LPSRPYAELTARELRRFGAQVEVQGSVWSVRGPLQAPSTPLVTEVDASAAAVALAAGAISGRMVSTDLTPDSGQGDARIVEHLRAFGAEVVCEAHTTRCRAEQLAGVDLDLADTPDLAPVLAAVAIVAALRQGQSSTLRGLRTLNRKESRRLDALVAVARTCGCSATAQNEEVLVIGPASSHGRMGQAPASVLVDAEGDHRLAFAGALLGLALPEVLVRDAEAVAKSWPSFWVDFVAAGGILIGPDAALASSRFGA
jgi:3-phosphoshikimate 1-carboxyvinyltransferase